MFSEEEISLVLFPSSHVSYLIHDINSESSAVSEQILFIALNYMCRTMKYCTESILKYTFKIVYLYYIKIIIFYVQQISRKTHIIL